MPTPLVPHDSDREVIDEKPFHDGNLLVQIIYDRHFNVHYVNIHRVNDNTDVNLHGVNRDEASARRLYDRIRL